jgi:hypothetical protein
LSTSASLRRLWSWSGSDPFRWFRPLINKQWKCYLMMVGLCYNKTILLWYHVIVSNYFISRGCCGRDPMVVGFTTTYAISAYHHYLCEIKSQSGEVYSIQHYAVLSLAHFYRAQRPPLSEWRPALFLYL